MKTTAVLVFLVIGIWMVGYFIHVFFVRKEEGRDIVDTLASPFLAAGAGFAGIVAILAAAALYFL